MTLAQRLVSCGAVRFGRFQLTSGAVSDHYIDVKAAMGHPDILRAIGDGIADVAGDTRYDAVAGMELGAVPIATAASLAADLPLLVVRKTARAHGTGRRIEGGIEDLAGKRVLVVEDVTTSGTSSAEAIEVLRGAGATVDRLVTVVDREAGAAARFASMGVQMHALVQVSELLAQRPEVGA